MNHLLGALALLVFTATASAQLTGDPPVQPPAGSPGKFVKPSLPVEKPKATETAAPRKELTRQERRAKRKATREAKVGPKPID